MHFNGSSKCNVHFPITVPKPELALVRSVLPAGRRGGADEGAQGRGGEGTVCGVFAVEGEG